MIFFIAGAGRSGSTLLDIILGNSEDHFSLGELINFVQNGLIENEYCSCGERVHDCEFWSEVDRNWAEVRKLSLREYKGMQWKYLRNKATIRSLWNYWFPSKKYKIFLEDTQKLISIIYKASGKKVLIDSSKIPQYLLLLKKTKTPIKIIHLTRSIKSVLRSTRKTLEKDPEKGLEKTINKQSFIYAYLNWLVDNLLVMIFTTSSERIHISYESLTKDPLLTISKIYAPNTKDIEVLKNRGPFKPNHLVAGGRIRMLKNVTIK